MDVCYYFSQIKEELEGASDYIDRAINCKSEHPEWASIYAKMSEMELGHADNLVRIFEEDYKTSKTDDPIYPALHESLIRMYTECSSNVKVRMQIYQAK